MKPPVQWILCVAVLSILNVCGIPDASAQRSSNISANSDVAIVQGIAIYKNSDLQFGAIVPGLSGGAVTLTPSGSRSATGTIVLPSSLAYNAAAFVVLGPPSQTFTLTLPTSITLGRAGGSNTMLVTNFVSNPSVNGTLNAGGSANVTVGATLTVGGSQTFGQYTGSFAVTVSYP